MTTTLERDLAMLAVIDPVVGGATPYEPLNVQAIGNPPKASPSTDESKGWVRRMIPLIAARKGRFAIALTASIIGLIAQVAVPRVVMAAIDAGLAKRTTPMSTFITALVVIGAVRAVFTFTHRNLLYKVAYDLEYDLRVNMYEHFSRLSFSFYDRVQSGQLISRANSDIRSVQMFLTFAPVLGLQMISFGVAFALMMQIHVPLSLVALAPLPFVFLTGLRMRKLMFPISWIVQERQAGVATVVEENVAGARVVKSFAAEQQQVDVLARGARRLEWSQNKQIDVRARYAPIMENLPRLGMAGVLLYGGVLAVHGEVTIGTIVAFSIYVVMLQAPFRMLGMLMMMGQRAAASAARIYEILDTPAEIVDRPGAVDLVDPVGRVELRDVSFTYKDGPQVLDGFTMTVEPGETVAIVGRTGCGKSTVARLLTRFYDVDGGAVLVDGKDVRELTLPSLRHHVGVVLDEPFLFSSSVRDNIAYGRPDAPMDEVVAAAKAANAHEFVMDLEDGYDSIIGERGYDLSGGQRQRIAIARTLLVNPKILVLDDATSAIDVHVEDLIHQALSTLLTGRTTVVIAHRLSTISLADRVCLLEGGKVVATGTHVELMRTEPRYTEVLAHIVEDDERRAAAAAAATPATEEEAG
ncbi:MAG TPA: ABC transporter ATP-binding protein [Acidimicrobiales bacterium]|nr:ABC transporter ATP-binding protein [Acidimicrobiales bacterium]